jgi:invasion protein IalB
LKTIMPHAFKSFTFSLLLAVAASCGQAQADDVSLPGGAGSLRETHGDWTVTCAIQTTQDGQKAKLCAFSQEQVHPQTRQRALAIELRPQASGVAGTLVLPFGLALERGAVYQLDEGQEGSVQKFRTCLPAGCLVDVDFDGSIVASLKAGKALKVKTMADGGQEMALSISLTGFSSAYQRTVELLR